MVRLWNIELRLCLVAGVSSSQPNLTQIPQAQVLSNAQSNVSVRYQPEDNQILLSYSPKTATEESSSSSTSMPFAEPSVPAAVGGYEVVAMSEPDLSKVPARSALKGGKMLEDSQRQLEQRRQDNIFVGDSCEARVSICSVSSTGSGGSNMSTQFTDGYSTEVHQDGVRVPPKVAPKPRGCVCVFYLLSSYVSTATLHYKVLNIQFVDVSPFLRIFVLFPVTNYKLLQSIGLTLIILLF